MPPLILPTPEEGNVMKEPDVEGAWLQLRSKRIIQTTQEDLRGKKEDKEDGEGDKSLSKLVESF